MTSKAVSIVIGLLAGCFLSINTLANNLSSTSFFQIVIDRTGSMVATRSSTGHARYQDAITQAETDLAKAMAEAAGNGGTLKVAVAMFESGAGFDIRMGFGTPGAAMAELQALKLMAPGASTPLADALCLAADELFTQSTVGSYKRVIGFYTDLDENASSGACSGVDWTSKVIQKFFSGFPAPIFNVTMFATDDNLTISAMNVLNTAASGVVNQTAASSVNSIKDEVAFMKALAQYTGGKASGFSDTKVDPVFGGGGSSGCGVFFPCAD